MNNDSLAKHIYLSGQMGAGKGWCEAILIDRGYVPLSWSDGVYQMVADNAGVTIEHIRQHKTKYRDQLQSCGHGMRTQYGEDYWINQRELEAAKHERTVESGTRYTNECRIGMNRGIVINIQTDFATRMERYYQAHGDFPTQSQIDHPNEALSAFLPRTIAYDNTNSAWIAKSWFVGMVQLASRMDEETKKGNDRLRIVNIVAALITARPQHWRNYGLSQEVYSAFVPMMHNTLEHGFHWVARSINETTDSAFLAVCHKFLEAGQESALLAALVQAKREGFRGQFVSGLVDLLREAAQHNGYDRVLEFIC